MTVALSAGITNNERFEDWRLSQTVAVHANEKPLYKPPPTKTRPDAIFK